MATNGSDTGGDGATESRTWEPGDAATLNALIAVADYSGSQLKSGGVPWLRNHQLDIVATGGLRSRSQRRVTVVPGSYSSYAKRALKMKVVGNHSSRFDHDLVSSVTGEDKLVVDGDADITIGERTTILTGTVNRTWTGGIVRLVGMEGVICGGVYAQILAGMSSTVAALFSGDVYGGCGRVAVSRNYIAALGYRSADGPVSWAMGAYVRKTKFVLEPVLGSPGPDAPDKGVKRVAKLTAKIGGGLCPFLEIFLGLGSLALLIPLKILAAVRKKMGKKKKPPTKLPRNRVRSCGVIKESATSDITL